MFNSKAKIFYYFLLCFIGGVAIRSFFVIEFFWIYLLGLIFLVLTIIFWQNKFWRYLFFGGVFIILGIWRYQLSLPGINPNKIWFYNGQKVNFEGVVVAEPDIRINQTKLIINSKQLIPPQRDPDKVGTINNKKLPVRGKVLVNVGLYPEYQYGDLVAVNCELKQPEPFEDFAYDRYLAKDKIYSQCLYPQVKLISSNCGDWLLTKIFKFKNKLRAIINANLPEPQASLFYAIILGSRGGIPSDLTTKFSLTGTSHLIAISGLNITLITVILMKLATNCYIPRKKSFWLITAILVGYIIIIGFSASAVRAAIMGFLVILASREGRLNQAGNALIFTAAIMILVNPKILRDDIGFQLSFLAMIGLIYISPFFEYRLEKLPSYFGIKESLQTTTSAQITTLPLIIYNFGRISLIALIANLLVLPILPYLMIIGIVNLIVSLFFSGIAQYLFWPVWLLLTYLVKLIEFFASIPLAAISL